MDVLLSSDGAWSSVTTGLEAEESEDDSRLTECGEGFLQMLLAITDRYKILPQPGHRFSTLIVLILNDFICVLLVFYEGCSFWSFNLNFWMSFAFGWCSWPAKRNSLSCLRAANLRQT